MSAVFGPKSLYSGLAIWSLPPLELNEANNIHETRTMYPVMSSQSAIPEPFARGTYKPARVSLPSSEVFLAILPFHSGQYSTAIAATTNNRLNHTSSPDAAKNPSHPR